MNKDMPPIGDDPTVLLARPGAAHETNTLTDAPAPPVFEQLKARMVYSARVAPPDAIKGGVNPLVAAASELLSLVVRIKHSATALNGSALHAELSEAVKSFEANTLDYGIDSEHMMKARYVLCTVLDETVVTRGFGDASDWSQKSLLSTFHNETFGGEKVFHFLDQLSKDPLRNLSMLELLYLCLSLGFEGKYRVVQRGMTELESIRDALYRQIRHVRGDVPRELSPHWQGLSHRRHSLIRSMPGWVLVTFTLGCLAVMFSGFAWVLGEQREAVLQPYQQLETPVVRSQS